MLFELPKDARLRHEWKHRISPADKLQLIARLRTFCKPDPHYGEESYHIRSLYFDNYRDKAMEERLNGMEYREKFRIRYYNLDDSYIVLERKSKHNHLCAKASCPVTREQVEDLLAGNIQWLAEHPDPLCRELHRKMHRECLRPKVIVDYTRRAFVYAPGNTRVTIDENIRTGLSSLDFFDPRLATVPAEITNPIVLEVKYDAFLPDIVRSAVQLSGCRTTAFSKYTAARLTNY